MGLILKHVSGSGGGGPAGSGIALTGSLLLTSSIVADNGGNYLGGGFINLPQMSLSSMLTGRSAGQFANNSQGALFVASSSAAAGKSSLWFMDDTGNMNDLIGGGTVDGSGAANRGTYWSDSDTVTSSGNWTFDGSAWSLTSTTWNLDASGNVTMDSDGSVTIGGAGVDIDADGSSKVTIDGAGGIDIGVNADVAVDIDAAALTVDASGLMMLTGSANHAAAVQILASHANGKVLIRGKGGSLFGDDTGAVVFDGSGAASTSGVTTLDLDGSGAVSLESSGGAINVGADAVAQAINIGTGAAARTITVGNSSGATGLVLNAGTGDIAVGTNSTAKEVSIGSSTGDSGLTLTAGSGGIAANYGSGNLEFDGTGVFSIDATSTTSDSNIKSAAGVVQVESGKSGADALILSASNAAGGVKVGAGTGGVQFDIAAAQVLNLDANSADFAAALTVNIDNTTNSTSNTTGGLIVDGGVGIAKDVHIGGLVDIDGRVHIGGDLEVDGTTTTVDTTNLEVKDKLIGLNYSSGSTAGSLADAGLVIGNSGGNQQAFFWDNGSTEFAVASTANGPGDASITIADYSDFKAQGISAQAVTGSTLMITPKIISAAGLDIDAGGSGKLSLDGPGGIDIGTAANVAIDMNASTLDIDAAGAVTIDPATTLDLRVGTAAVIAAGTTMYVSGATGARFGDDTGYLNFDGSGAMSTVSTTDILLDASGDIILDAGGADITFKDDGAEKLYFNMAQSGGPALRSSGSLDSLFGHDSGQGTASSGQGFTEVFRIDTSASSLLMATNKKIEFGVAGEYIAGDGTDLEIASSESIDLNASTDVIIPEDIGLVLDGGMGAKKIEGQSESNGNTLSITNSAGNIMLGAASSGYGAVVPSSANQFDLGQRAVFAAGSAISGFTTYLSNTTINPGSDPDLLWENDAASVGGAKTNAAAALNSQTLTTSSTSISIASGQLTASEFTVGSVIVVGNAGGDRIIFAVTSSISEYSSSISVKYVGNVATGISGTATSVALNGSSDTIHAVNFSMSGTKTGAPYLTGYDLTSGKAIALATSAGALTVIGLTHSVSQGGVYARVSYISGRSDASSIAKSAVDAVNAYEYRSRAAWKSLAVNDVYGDSSNGLDFYVGETKRFIMATDSFKPEADNSYDLGAADKRFRNIYTGDLHLANERGNWTLVEESNMLTFRNNLTGKWYKMAMEEIDPTGRDEGMNGPAPTGSPDSPAGDPDWEI